MSEVVNREKRIEALKKRVEALESLQRHRTLDDAIARSSVMKDILPKANLDGLLSAVEVIDVDSLRADQVDTYKRVVDGIARLHPSHTNLDESIESLGKAVRSLKA